MKVLLTGSTGQLGNSIIDTKSENIDLITTNREQLDLSNPEYCEEFILSEKPDWVINCAAFTAVDLAEKDFNLAKKINSFAPQAFANAINKINGNLLQISTDFVFKGDKCTPYSEKDLCSPINVYGKSKLEGETLSLKYAGNIVLRTSWLFSSYGDNFLIKILNLHKNLSKDSKCLNVVYDQIGSPTTTGTLAKAIWDTIKSNISFSRENKKFPRTPEIIIKII